MARKIIEVLEYDKKTGIPFIRDIEGYTYLLEKAMPPNRTHRVYLQAYCKEPWLSTTEFYSITCSLTGNPLIYIVPSDKSFYAAFIMAAQQHSKTQNLGVSLIGLYINDIRHLMVPFRSELAYALFEPLLINSSMKVELKYKPFDKKAILGILAGGFLSESD